MTLLSTFEQLEECRWRQVPQLVRDWSARALAVDGELEKDADLRSFAEQLNLLPNAYNHWFGGPSPLAAAITGGVLGAGAGYGAGWLGEKLLPERWQRGRLRKSLAIAGGLLGTLPGAGWAWGNYLDKRPLNSGELYNTPRDPNWAKPLGQLREKLSSLPRNENWEKLSQQFAVSAGSFGSPPVNVDALGRVLWADPRVAPYVTPGARAAATGLAVGASQLSGSPWVTPSDIGRVAAGMGLGYVSGALVGKALGILLGMPPQTQQLLKNTGMFAGAVNTLVPQLFRQNGASPGPY